MRRALAAEPAAPMPRDVVDRLEATLADLTAERVAGQRSSSKSHVVVPARRRHWPTLLVAAASVAVLGVGIGAVMQNMSGGADSSTAGQAEDSSTLRKGQADGGHDSEAEGGPGATSESEAPQPRDPVRSEADIRLALAARPARLRSDSLAADAARALDARQVPASAVSGRVRPGAPASEPGSDIAAAARLVSACALPDVGDGDLLVAARLDGQRSTLVLRQPQAGTRLAEVYACGDATRPLAQSEVDER